MDEAVEKLAAVLKEQDLKGTLDQSADTQELITRISTEITRMIDDDEDEESESEDAALSPGGLSNSPGAAEVPSRSPPPRTPRSGAPVYPTPYDVWQTVHPEVREAETPRESLKLTEEGWTKLVDRLNKSSTDRHVAKMRAQHKLIKDELSSLSFSPHINQHSREIAQVAPLHERLEHILKLRHEKLDKQRRKMMDREVAELTGTPKINTTKRWRARVRNNYISRGVPEEDKDAAEMTFSPQINPRSRKLWRRAKERNRLRERHAHRERKPKNDTSDPGHQEETFTPEINYRSRALARGKDGAGEAHERLYEMARQKNLASRRAEQRHFRKHVRNVTIPTTRLGSALDRRGHPTATAGGEGHREVPLHYEGTEPVFREPEVTDPRHGGVNVVSYKPTMDFILQRINNMDPADEDELDIDDSEDGVGALY